MNWIPLSRARKLAIPFNAVPFKAMILAAGRGERMRPLTDHSPKPLLRAGSHSLIEYQLTNLARAGFVEIVINHAYLGYMIEHALGTGERYGVTIRYSPEKVVLETAGGIANALPLLTDESRSLPFLVVNGDIYCDMEYAALLPVMQAMHSNRDNSIAHLILVDNPLHHAMGDFALQGNKVALAGVNSWTFSGIGVYRPQLFADVNPGLPAKLAPLLRKAIEYGQVTGERFTGQWVDVGTPDRLESLDRQLSLRQCST